MPTPVEDGEADHAAERAEGGEGRGQEPERDLMAEDPGEDPEQKRQVADPVGPAEDGRLGREPGREPEENQGAEQPQLEPGRATQPRIQGSRLRTSQRDLRDLRPLIGGRGIALEAFCIRWPTQSCKRVQYGG
jgi:hypothetical protein